MKKGLSTLLRAFGFNRLAPTTDLGRTWRRLERAGMVLVGVYLLLLAFPQVLFAHHVTVQGILLYSRTPLLAEATACVTRAAALVRQSELAMPGRSERVFICDSPWLFGLFSPTSAGAFGFSLALTDNVFVAAADFTRDEAHSSARAHNVRSLSAVLAHEITHGLIRQRLGLVRGMVLPAWAAEGYCEYVAGEGSFPEPEGLRLMIAGGHDPSGSFQYFKDRQMVRYLIDTRHGSFADVVARAHDAETVEAETKHALRAAAVTLPARLLP